jgi:hypothetical protein
MAARVRRRVLASQIQLEQVMGIEPTPASLPEVRIHRLGALPNTECDARVNLRVTLGIVASDSVQGPRLVDSGESSVAVLHKTTQSIKVLHSIGLRAAGPVAGCQQTLLLSKYRL